MRQPTVRTPIAPRCRAAVSRAPGGASSLLRLSSSSTPRLPGNTLLGQWIGRAARALRHEAHAGTA